jgi:chromate transporter
VEPSLAELFRGFLEVTLSGFGGVLAWSHRTFVERRKWLSESEFVELLGLSQILPGGNIINLAVFMGLRFHGIRGVLVALAGLMVAPLCLLLVLNLVLSGPGLAGLSQRALHGAAPVVAGFTLSAGLKMLRAQRWTATGACFGAITLVSVGVLQLPLVLVVAAIAPTSLIVGWWTSR